MSNAPERIFASPPHDDPEWSSGSGEWDVSDGWAVDPIVEYIRADKVSALVDAVEYILDGMGIDGTDYAIDPKDEFLDAANSEWVRDVLTRLAVALAALDAKGGKHE